MSHPLKYFILCPKGHEEIIKGFKQVNSMVRYASWKYHYGYKYGEHIRTNMIVDRAVSHKAIVSIQAKENEGQLERYLEDTVEKSLVSAERCEIMERDPSRMTLRFLLGSAN